MAAVLAGLNFSAGLPAAQQAARQPGPGIMDDAGLKIAQAAAAAVMTRMLAQVLVVAGCCEVTLTFKCAAIRSCSLRLSNAA